MLSCGVHETLLCCIAKVATPIAGCCLTGMHAVVHSTSDSRKTELQCRLRSYKKVLCNNSLICNSLGSHNKAVLKSNLLRILEM